MKFTRRFFSFIVLGLSLIIIALLSLYFLNKNNKISASFYDSNAWFGSVKYEMSTSDEYYMYFEYPSDNYIGYENIKVAGGFNAYFAWRIPYYVVDRSYDYTYYRITALGYQEELPFTFDMMSFNSTDVMFYFNNKLVGNMPYSNNYVAFTRGYIPKDVDYQQGYKDGYSMGISDGYSNGYDTGFLNAKLNYGYFYNGDYLGGSAAYDLGYTNGLGSNDKLKLSIINFVPSVLGSLFMFFFQLGQIGILGISVLDVLGVIVIITGLFFLIKMFF